MGDSCAVASAQLLPCSGARVREMAPSHFVLRSPSPPLPPRRHLPMDIRQVSPRPSLYSSVELKLYQLCENWARRGEVQDQSPYLSFNWKSALFPYPSHGLHQRPEEALSSFLCPKSVGLI